jgi:hypothetical protein
MRMLQPRNDLYLLEEAPDADSVGQLLLEDLDRDGTPVPGVLGEEDDSHAALSELAVDAVPVSDGGLELSAQRFVRLRRCGGM